MKDEKIKIAAVVGPTACGKTALSIGLAGSLGGEIVCCDSMQIYRGMEIGTAAPSESEKEGIPHHLFGFADPAIPFSCADYAALADEKINEITSREKLPILVGGTGLYLDAVLLGCGDTTAAPDEEYREELRKLAETEGNMALHALLAEKDPEAAAAIHPNNLKRVIRALEICRTGISKTEYDKKSRGDMRYDAKVVGLRFSDRELLYSRINRRVDIMLADGLCDEIRRLDAQGVFETSGTAAQAIGYKELLGYIRGSGDYDASVEELKKSTRRYAKRQMTWFGSKPYIDWIDVDRENSSENIIKKAADIINIS